jgi:hypothetical protein
MVEREIVGGREGEGGEWEWKQIKCGHCDGKGRCNCYSCVAEEVCYDGTSGRFVREKKEPLSAGRYKSMLEDNPNFTVNCKKCNGFGFVLIDKNGEVKIPKVKKE